MKEDPITVKQQRIERLLALLQWLESASREDRERLLEQALEYGE